VTLQLENPVQLAVLPSPQMWDAVQVAWAVAKDRSSETAVNRRARFMRISFLKRRKL